MKNYIALDVGGTSISASIVSSTGTLLVPVQQYPALSGENKETILSNLAGIMNRLLEEAERRHLSLNGAGIAFPGPFDYENGISFMRGLRKFDAIYGIKIAEEIKPGLKADLELRFQNDVDLYCLGECLFGVGKEYNRCLCISIGTGINSGFFADGRLLKFGKGIPENGWIYDLPYRDSIITDYVSATGIRTMMERSSHLGEVEDVKELAQAAYGGSQEAIKIFEEFGMMLSEVVVPFTLTFKPEIVILGGDVSRSHNLFDKQITEALTKKNIQVIPSLRFAINTLLACSTLFESR